MMHGTIHNNTQLIHTVETTIDFRSIDDEVGGLKETINLLRFVCTFVCTPRAAVTSVAVVSYTSHHPMTLSIWAVAMLEPYLVVCIPDVHNKAWFHQHDVVSAAAGVLFPVYSTVPTILSGGGACL